MKNLTGNFLAKLIASMPIEAIRKTTEVETRRQGKKVVPARKPGSCP